MSKIGRRWMVVLIGWMASSTLVAKETPPEGRSKAESLCVTVFERMRECTDDFLPAVVELRVQLDLPPGIAEADRLLGRKALLAKAREEWKEDSTDAAIAATCTREAARGGELPGLETCLAEESCKGFVTCLEPFLDNMLL